MSSATPPASGENEAAGDKFTPATGTVIAGRYTLIEKLGEGAMGEVWRADHAAVRKTVAVKLLHPHARQDADIVERFRREALAAANLQHPNIVEAFDLGELEDGTLYLVMQFVEGRPLRAVIDDAGALAPERALSLLRQVGAALVRAHAAGVVHRDLKPDNILISAPVDPDGPEVVKIIDFGIAHVRGASFSTGAPEMLTKMGMMFGTPAYMSPEQAMGQPVDARVDQYALGVITFEMLTGKPPFESAELVELLHKHIGADIPNASEFNPRVPKAVDNVIARMMAKLPNERFEDVASAMRALEPTLTASAATPTTGSTDAGAAPSTAQKAPAVDANATTQDRPTVGRAGEGGDTRGAANDNTVDAGLRLRVVSGLVGVVMLLATAIFWPRAVNRPEETPRIGHPQGLLGAAGPTTALGPHTGDLAGANVDASRAATRDRVPVIGDWRAGLALWSQGGYDLAMPMLRSALLNDAALAADETFVRDVMVAITTDRGRDALRSLIDGTPLGTSPALLRSLTALAIDGDGDERRAAVNWLEVRSAQLGAVERTRVQLRAARRCDELEAARAALEAGSDADGQTDAQRVLAGDCDMLVRPALCRRCGHPPASP